MEPHKILALKLLAMIHVFVCASALLGQTLECLMRHDMYNAFWTNACAASIGVVGSTLITVYLFRHDVKNVLKGALVLFILSISLGFVSSHLFQHEPDTMIYDLIQSIQHPPKRINRANMA